MGEGKKILINTIREGKIRGYCTTRGRRGKTEKKEMASSNPSQERKGFCIKEKERVGVR